MTKEGTIICRKSNSDDTLIGTKNTNPIFDTRVYDLSFPDGLKYDLATTAIVNNLFDSASEDRDHHAYLESITDVR